MYLFMPKENVIYNLQVFFYFNCEPLSKLNIPF